MKKCVVIEYKGGVFVNHPAPEHIDMLREPFFGESGAREYKFSLDEAVEKHAQNLVSEQYNGAVFKIVMSDDLPSDRAFRAAWRLGGAGKTKVIVDLPRARAMALEMLRQKRNEALAASDAEALSLRAKLAAGKATADEVEAHELWRQSLRDAPEAVAEALAAAKTTDDIKSAIALPERAGR